MNDSNLNVGYKYKPFFWWRERKDIQDHGALFELIAAPPIVIFGLVGNCLLFILMTRDANSRPFTIIMKGLAVADSGALIHEILVWINVLSARKYGFLLIDPRTNIACKLCYDSIFTNLMASWFLVLLSLERCVAMNFPMFSHVHLNQKTTQIGLIFISAICFMMTIIWSTFSSVSSSGVCYRVPIPKLYALLMISFVNYIPLMILIIFNIWTMVAVVKMIKRPLPVSNSDDQERLKNCVVYLLVISFIYIFTRTPFFLDRFWSQISEAYPNWLWYTWILYLINHCSNFVVVVMYGKYYRTKFKEMCLGHKDENQIVVNVEGGPVTTNQIQPSSSDRRF